MVVSKAIFLGDLWEVKKKKKRLSMSAAERKLAQIFHRQGTSFRNLNNSVAVGVEWNVSSFVDMFLSQKRL